MTAGRDVALVLAGGATLGAYHAGVWAGLEAAGIMPGRVLGTSIGAITAALIFGNPPDLRQQRLTEFWARPSQAGTPFDRLLPQDLRARLGNDYGLFALLNGRPGVFSPRWPGLWSILPFMPRDNGLRDPGPLRRTLEELIDVDILNRSETRVSIMATDVETGEDVWFDTTDGGITVDHLLAATGLMPLFPPVTIGDRTLCDAGLSANLPVHRLFETPLPRDLLCIAADCFHPTSGVPRSVDQTLTRAQDLVFWLQSRHRIEGLQALHTLRRQIDPSLPKVTLGYMAYRAADHERSLKALDFSAPVLARRTRAGRTDTEDLLTALVTQTGHEAFQVVTPEPASQAARQVA